VQSPWDYDLFVSHATRPSPDHRDYVDRVVAELRTLQLRVFLDRDVLERGRLLTERALSSAWVVLEVERFAGRQRSGSFPAIVLILDPGIRPPDMVRWSAQLSVDALLTPADAASRIGCALAASGVASHRAMT